MRQHWIALGSLFAFVAVATGAFGAHALKARLSEYSLGVWNTGAQYQMYHALALIAFGLWTRSSPGASSLAGWAFVFGSLVFPGSLYALALTDVKVLGAITPLGGAAFLLGWLAFAFGAWRGGERKRSVKRASDAPFAFDPNAPAVSFDDVFRDVEAQARAAAAGSLVGLPVAVKHSRQVFGRDAASGVADLEYRRIALPAGKAGLDLAARAGKLDRVADQIRKDLNESISVAAQKGQVLGDVGR
jgi:uncharacterized membrane protein YgdD (TMEM256/DUF423 family)